MRYKLSDSTTVPLSITTSEALPCKQKLLIKTALLLVNELNFDY